MDKENTSNYFKFSIFILVIGLIAFFTYQSYKPTPGIVFSQDDGKSVIKTLTIDEVKTLTDDSQARQVIYVGCRYCPHCQNFEPTLNKFVEDMPKPFSSDRQTVVKWEAGYECYLKEGDPKYDLYQTLSDKLLQDNGVPQFILYENGAVKDKLVGEQSAEALLDFYKRNQILPYAN